MFRISWRNQSLDRFQLVCQEILFYLFFNLLIFVFKVNLFFIKIIFLLDYMGFIFKIKVQQKIVKIPIAIWVMFSSSGDLRCADSNRLLATFFTTQEFQVPSIGRILNYGCSVWDCQSSSEHQAWKISLWEKLLCLFTS